MLLPCHSPAEPGRPAKSLARLVRLLGLCGLLATGAPLLAAGNAALPDLTSLSLDQLLNLQVFSASKFTQKVSEAPSAVTVISAEDIRTFGYRTLADVLKSIRGLYVNYDRNYSYLGARGFARAGDYNTRILLLVDGYRLNDNIYDQAPPGTEFPVDVDLIERVEYVPGPGSAIYGNNAFFGVINVITKNSLEGGSTHLTGEAASRQTYAGRIGFSKRLDNDSQLLLHASGYDSRGGDVFFPEFNDPASNNGVAHNGDYDRYRHFFAKLSQGPLQWETGYGWRKKGIPTASFGQIFDDPRSHTVDEYLFTQLKYQWTLGADWQLYGSVNYGSDNYDGNYIYAPPPGAVNMDRARGQWWGGDLRLLSYGLRGHKLMLGLEYRDDFRRDLANFDDNPHVIFLDHRSSKRSLGLYAQDEWTLRDGLLLSAGLRYDHASQGADSLNPRLGLIYQWSPRTTVKLLYGTAYRAPNVYEQFYVTDASRFKASPDLKAENITTYEAVLEHFLHEDLRLVASVYHYEIRNLVSLTQDQNKLFFFDNLLRAEANGIELEAEKLFERGARLRSSVSFQSARDSASGDLLPNSPRQMAKINYSLPLFGDKWRAGLEALATSNRKTIQGGTVAGVVLTNLTLSSVRLSKHLEVSASVYNLFDRAYGDPPSREHFDILGRTLQQIPQDGRSFRLTLDYSL